ncbi:MAG: stage V sporulation protein AD [Bacillota bacterium]
MSKRLGQQTVVFSQPPIILSAASVVGPEEGNGPLGQYFDVVKQDRLLGQKSWELAEKLLCEEACDLAIKKVGFTPQRVDFFLAGDLLNQIITASFSAQTLGVPFLGLFGACSTLAEGLALGGMLLDGGFATCVLTACASHHDTAERQYRYPTELGVQRPPTAQWTVTGAGAVLLGLSGPGPRLTHCTVGKVISMGLKDPSDLGSAMAPAAAETIWQHLQDTGRLPADYDLIATGDLGAVGHPICGRLLADRGVALGENFTDCGLLIYDRKKQRVDAGGSGCGCSAVVFASYLVPRLVAKEIRRLLLVPTGALFSTTSWKQGQEIPAVAHAVAVEIPA